jgi:hypothetical protein
MTLHARPYLSLIFSLLSFTAFTQENYQDGYIVRSGADTVRGRIDYREWYYNPQQISFQDGKTGKRSLFQPGGIIAFFTGGETYQSFKVTIHPYTLSTEKLTNNFQDAPYDSTVFLRLLMGGQLNLYYYHGHDEVEYFFTRRLNETPVQLRVKTILVDDNGVKAVSREDLYIDQLRLLVSECPALSGRISHVAYDEKDLRKLIFGYNNCGKDTVERQEGTAQAGKLIRFIPLAGYVRSSVRTNGTYEGVSGLTWPGYNGIIGGIGVQFVMPRTRQQFSFFTDLLYSHFYSKTSSYAVNSANVETGYIYYNYLQLDIQFRYQVPGGKVRPFVNAGISNTLILNNNNYINDHETGVAVDTRTPIFGTPLPNGGINNPSPYEFGLMGGVGFTVGRLSLEARVQESDGIASEEQVNAPMKYFYLLAGFSF